MRALLVTAACTGLLALLLPTPTAAMGDPTSPCTTGIAGSWCTVSAANCSITVGTQTAPEHYEYARVYCGPELWAPCTVLYVNTDGTLFTCLLG